MSVARARKLQEFFFVPAHFHKLQFVLVCPPVQIFLLHNEVFNCSVRPLGGAREKFFQKIYYGPLAGPQ
jgi:hypothetical protein